MTMDKCPLCPDCNLTLGKMNSRLAALEATVSVVAPNAWLPIGEHPEGRCHHACGEAHGNMGCKLEGYRRWIEHDVEPGVRGPRCFCTEYCRARYNANRRTAPTIAEPTPQPVATPADVINHMRPLMTTEAGRSALGTAPPVTAKVSEDDNEECPASCEDCGAVDHCDKCGMPIDGSHCCTSDICFDCRRGLETKVSELETALDAANAQLANQASALATADGDREELRRRLASRDYRIAGLEASAAEDSKERAALEARCASAEHDAGVLARRIANLSCEPE